jgi:hypothetical protein
MKRRPLGWPAVTFGLAVATLLAAPVSAQEQKVGDQPEAMNMRLVGYNDLAGPQRLSAADPQAERSLDRLYRPSRRHNDVPKPMNKLTGQAEFNGTSIVDVTDPAHPKYLKHIPGTSGKLRTGRRPDGAGLRRQEPAQGRSQQVLSAARVRQFQGHEIWDTTDPASPSSADPRRHGAQGHP